MATLRRSNHFAIRLTAFGLTAFLLFLLGGCAITPKSASSRFDSFAQATTDMGTQVTNAYVLDETMSKKLRIKQFIAQYTQNKSALRIATTDQADNIIAIRQGLLLGLTVYATCLKNIMNDEPLSTFSKNAAAAGSELADIQSTLNNNKVSISSSISITDLGSAVGEIGKFLMDLKRREQLKSTIEHMQPAIHSIVAYLKIDIGKCETRSQDGKTIYCGQESVSQLNKEASDLGTSYCKNLDQYDFDYQTEIRQAANSPVRDQKASKKLALTAEQQKLAEQQAELAWQAKYSCQFLAYVQKSLDAFEAVHQALPQAFDKQSSALSQALDMLNLQIALAKDSYKSTSTTEEKKQ